MKSPWEDQYAEKHLPPIHECAAHPWIGLLHCSDHRTSRGHLLLWRPHITGLEATSRAYRGDPGADVAILLLADDDAFVDLHVRGTAALRSLVTRGKVLPLILRPDAARSPGLSDFIEDLGLVFPRH